MRLIIPLMLVLAIICAGCKQDAKLHGTEEGNTTKSQGAKAELPKTITTESGLKYEDIVVGTGKEAKPGQFAIVHYTGWLENGTQFDSSLDRGKPFTFALGKGKVIKGWEEGITGMKIGGKRILYIPPELGYGKTGAGSAIPPNATLIFEVELLDLK